MADRAVIGAELVDDARGPPGKTVMQEIRSGARGSAGTCRSRSTARCRAGRYCKAAMSARRTLSRAAKSVAASRVSGGPHSVLNRPQPAHLGFRRDRRARPQRPSRPCGSSAPATRAGTAGRRSFGPPRWAERVRPESCVGHRRGVEVAFGPFPWPPAAAVGPAVADRRKSWRNVRSFVTWAFSR